MNKVKVFALRQGLTATTHVTHLNKLGGAGDYVTLAGKDDDNHILVLSLSRRDLQELLDAIKEEESNG